MWINAKAWGSECIRWQDVSAARQRGEGRERMVIEVDRLESLQLWRLSIQDRIVKNRGRVQECRGIAVERCPIYRRPSANASRSTVNMSSGKEWMGQREPRCRKAH